MEAVVIVPTSHDPIDNISPVPLDAFHVFSSCSLSSPSPECHQLSIVNHYDMFEGTVFDCLDSLGTFRGYDPSFDPYSLYILSRGHYSLPKRLV